MDLFDAHLGPCCDSPDPETVGKLASLLSGALTWGIQSAAWRSALAAVAPEKQWLHAEGVAQLIGPDDPRFPQTHPDVLDLAVSDAELHRLLQLPDRAWFPLLKASHGRCGLRLNLPPNGGAIPLIKKLVRGFPETLFLVDAFRHGPRSGWVPQVRLAENENVRVTTQGLAPGDACTWPDPSDVAAAFYYVSGEVGVGKLIFASGATPQQLAKLDYKNWLSSIPCLDEAQRELIAFRNVQELQRVR